MARIFCEVLRYVVLGPICSHRDIIPALFIVNLMLWPVTCTTAGESWLLSGLFLHALGESPHHFTPSGSFGMTIRFFSAVVCCSIQLATLPPMLVPLFVPFSPPKRLRPLHWHPTNPLEHAHRSAGNGSASTSERLAWTSKVIPFIAPH